MALSDKGQQVLDIIKEMPVTELNELVKSLEEEFGVSAAPVAVGGGGGGGAEGGEEGGGGSDTVNIELTEIGQQKITVIKTIKEALGMGLKEAKEIVEKTPVVLKEGVKQDEGEDLKSKLEEAGATITMK